MADRQRATFEDFALAFGGGANIFLTSHIAIRPQIDLLLVTTQDDTRPDCGLRRAPRVSLRAAQDAIEETTMLTLRRILCPIDFSESSRQALILRQGAQFVVRGAG
jgi:hypothetical protein